MSIGLCCQYIVEKTNRNGVVSLVNNMQERSLQYGLFTKGKYTDENIVNVYRSNVTNLFNMMPVILNDGIKSLRISSNLFPLYDSVKPDLLYDDQVLNILKSIGKFALQNDMRITCHPDQWCVLNSKTPSVITKSINILAHHAWVFDKMDLPATPFYAINIHGGVKDNSIELIKSIDKLCPTAKNRLTLENDERSCNVLDLLEVYKKTDVPIAFDSHHHSFNDAGLEPEKAFDISVSTWGSVKPLTHLSNTEPELTQGSFTDRRKHSKDVYYIPDYQLQANNNGLIDIDFEFKNKNLAIKKAVNLFKIKLS